VVDFAQRSQAYFGGIAQNLEGKRSFAAKVLSFGVGVGAETVVRFSTRSWNLCG
jgi:hypothetical protein